MSSTQFLGSERSVSSHLREPGNARDQVHGYLWCGIRTFHLVMSLKSFTRQ